ncbi:hypothetical protein B6U96_15565 [Archaeoglobales archaeon ex4484_92]|nr:MAG: hypothetical protein B6U96_15565 [Archaeoglobales archaeon ex4484_92]
MRANLVYWLDKVGGTTDKAGITLKPFGYRMARMIQWKALIADEDVCLERGKPTIVKIKPIELPGNTMVGLLSIMRHALGIVKDVVECGIPDKVEEDKCIDQVLFLPIENGEIKKGDLVGILKVFFVRPGLLSKILGLSPPKIQIEERKVEAMLTWRDDSEMYREKFNTRELAYTSSGIGFWELLIANEDVKVKNGDIVRTRIGKISLPRNTIVEPLGIMRHAYGTVLDVIQLGKPKRVEEKKEIDQAIFLAVNDGRIEAGDIIGVINVTYVGFEINEANLVKIPRKVKIVYRSGRGIIRKEILAEPFGYKMRMTARWECLISDENKRVRCGEPTFVKVEPVEVPKNVIVYPLSIMRHAYGTVIDVSCDHPLWRIENGGLVSKVLYLPIIEGEIRKGDLLGVLNLHEIEVSSLTKVKDWLNRWMMEMGEVVSYSDWPFGSKKISK